VRLGRPGRFEHLCPRLYARCAPHSPSAGPDTTAETPPERPPRRMARRPGRSLHPRVGRSARTARRDRVDGGGRGLRRGHGRSGCRHRPGWRRGSRAADVARRLDRAGRRSGKEEQRVEVPVFLGGLSDPEVHVGYVELRSAARPDRSDRIAFLHGISTPHAERPEVQQRRGIAVRRLDRDGLAPIRDAAGEGDRPGGGRDDRSSAVGSDVYSSVLACRVRVRRIEGEPHQHRARHGPVPTGSRSRDDQCGSGSESDQAHREIDLRCQVCKRRDRSKARPSLSNLITARSRRGGCARLQ